VLIDPFGCALDKHALNLTVERIASHGTIVGFGCRTGKLPSGSLGSVSGVQMEGVRSVERNA